MHTSQWQHINPSMTPKKLKLRDTQTFQH